MKIYNVNLENKQSMNKSISKSNKVLPRYSNLKLQPQLQTDVVMFKGIENVLTKEQNALNNLKSLLKQNIINGELNDILTKEVNSKNKNVIKYLNKINASKDPALIGYKAVAERLVENHAQLSGAIASSKIDNEKKIKLDYDNQIRMIIGISQIYEEDKAKKTNEIKGEITFGGRKDRAMAIIKEHSAIASIIAGGNNILIMVPNNGETFSLGSDILSLIKNELVMVKRIASEYERPIIKSIKDASINSSEEKDNRIITFSTGATEIDSLLNQATDELTKKVVKPALLFMPYDGPIVDTDFASSITNKLGESVVKVYQQETGNYD